MTGRFMLSAETPPEELDWGSLRWMSHPPSTEAKQLTVIEVTLSPGKGHDFHKHPDQEEVIYVIDGSVEQWLDQEKRILGPGDSVFIDADEFTLHSMSGAVKRSSWQSSARASGRVVMNLSMSPVNHPGTRSIPHVSPTRKSPPPRCPKA